MTRQELEHVHVRGEPVKCMVGDYLVHLMPKVFKTGSLGWHGQAKIRVSDTECQLNVVLTAIGSRNMLEPEKEVNSLNTSVQAEIPRKRAPKGPKSDLNGKAVELEPETPPSLLRD